MPNHSYASGIRARSGTTDLEDRKKVVECYEYFKEHGTRESVALWYRMAR